MWHPLVDALFAPCPMRLRLRLLLFLPITLFIYSWKSLPYLFSRPFIVYHIPTRRPSESLRALVYNHPSRCPTLKNGRKRPLHVDIHGGGFIGGIPEDNAPFCTHFAETTGAVVVSLTYRFAPRCPFPAAHDDVADALTWLLETAEKEFRADTQVLTVSGISAGGNLALGAALGAKDSNGSNIIKGAVTFYSPVDLRLPPERKRKPPGFPSFDPAWFLLPLFDAYAGPGRIENMENARLHPTLASFEDLPNDILFVIPTIDILLDEQLEMLERLQGENLKDNNGNPSPENSRRIEKLVFEGQWHGWLGLPSWFINESTRQKAFVSAHHFLMDVHRRCGFDISELEAYNRTVPRQ